MRPMSNDHESGKWKNSGLPAVIMNRKASNSIDRDEIYTPFDRCRLSLLKKNGFQISGRSPFYRIGFVGNGLILRIIICRLTVWFRQLTVSSIVSRSLWHVSEWSGCFLQAVRVHFRAIYGTIEYLA